MFSDQVNNIRKYFTYSVFTNHEIRGFERTLNTELKNLICTTLRNMLSNLWNPYLYKNIQRCESCNSFATFGRNRTRFLPSHIYCCNSTRDLKSAASVDGPVKYECQSQIMLHKCRVSPKNLAALGSTLQKQIQLYRPQIQANVSLRVGLFVVIGI